MVQPDLILLDFSLEFPLSPTFYNSKFSIYFAPATGLVGKTILVNLFINFLQKENYDVRS